MAEHDSAVWQTIAGWIWACRTCHAHGLAATRRETQAQRQAHDARPLPWWVTAMEATR